MVAADDKPLYKAVCYRCKYEGSTAATKCPNCSFPVILEAENTPPGGASLDDLLRSDASRPRLPGVANDELVATEVPRVAEPPRTPQADAIPSPPPARSGRRWQQIKVAAVCTAAIAAGVLSAVIHQGL